jgi:hypothetical protein
MVMPDRPTADAGEVRLIRIGAVAHHAADVDRVLVELQGDPMYRFRMLREEALAYRSCPW